MGIRMGDFKSPSYNFLLIELKRWENILDMLYYYIKNYEKKNDFSKFQNPCNPLIQLESIQNSI